MEGKDIKKLLNDFAWYYAGNREDNDGKSCSDYVDDYLEENPLTL